MYDILAFERKPIPTRVRCFKYKPQNRFELVELIKDKNIYLGDIDTSQITDMSNLFLRAKRKDFSGIEKWNTSNVITMEGMFSGCGRFNVPINCWDVSKVKNMSYMFSGARNFNQSLNNWEISNLKNDKNMFVNCKSFTYSLTKNKKISIYSF